MSCIVSHKLDTGERNLKMSGALWHADVCINELQLDHIQHQSMTFQGQGRSTGSSVGCKNHLPVNWNVALFKD